MLTSINAAYCENYKKRTNTQYVRVCECVRARARGRETADYRNVTARGAYTYH